MYVLAIVFHLLLSVVLCVVVLLQNSKGDGLAGAFGGGGAGQAVFGARGVTTILLSRRRIHDQQRGPRFPHDAGRPPLADQQFEPPSCRESARAQWARSSG